MTNPTINAVDLREHTKGRAEDGHTSWPWTVEDFRETDDCWHIHGIKGQWIASVHFEGDERAKKDAVLIGAAPSLLGALRQAKADLEKSGYIGAGVWGAGDPEINRIDAAIRLTQVQS